MTNGNAFTAAIVEDQLTDLLADLSDRRVAVVGATGSVGTTLVRLLAHAGSVDSLLLVARGRTRLEALAAEVGRRVPTTVSTDVHDVRGCDAVVLLTASADALLGAEHLAPGARVLDATQPRNTSPDLAAARPDVTVVDGGIVEVPGMHLRGGDVGLPPRAGVRVLRGDAPAGAGRPRRALRHRDADPRPRRARARARAAVRRRGGRARQLRPSGAGRCPVRRVVLLGGGYVTLHAYGALARRLRGELRRGEVEIVVISADTVHNFHGFTGEVVAGLLPIALTQTPLTEAMPLARVLHATVTHVDLVGRRVEFTGGELGYDALVVGTGGREPLERSTAREHALTLRGPGDLAELLQRVRVVDGPVVVVGGGLAGVELAAALAARTPRVVLVQSADRVVPALRAAAAGGPVHRRAGAARGGRPHGRCGSWRPTTSP